MQFWHSKICSVVQLKISSFVQTVQYIPERPKEEKPLVKKIMQPIGPESNIHITYNRTDYEDNSAF